MSDTATPTAAPVLGPAGTAIAAPHALADTAWQAQGQQALQDIFGDATRYTALERAGQAAYLPATHRLCDWDRASLWALVESGQLDVSRHEFRMVKTDEQGFNCLPPEAYTRPGTTRADPQRVRRCYEDGATMAVQLLDRYHPRFQQLCTALAARTGHPCQVSAYLSPPHSQGLDIHHDTHDVVVLQIDGEKRFHIYPTVLERPLPQMHLDAAMAHRLSPLASHTLRAGDVLYLPRGVPHSADASAHGSLHLSIGLRAVTWASLMKALADELYCVEGLSGQCAPRAVFEPAALCADAQRATQSLIDWLGEFGAQRLAALAAQRYVESFGERPPDPSGELPAVALDPDPYGGAHVQTPHGRTHLDAGELDRWYRRQTGASAPRLA